MQARVVSGLVGAGAMLLLVLIVNLAGLPRWQFPITRGGGIPGPTPIVVGSPSVGPVFNPTPSSSPLIVPTPTPNQFANRFRELPIPKPGGTPYALVVGPDGAVWFTEAECTSGIGRLAKNGQWQHWPINASTCGAQPLAITRGSDGNLWFADVGARYGRITPQGEITEFRMQTPSYPSGITTGPDGNLWLAAASPTLDGFIAKIRTDGTELAEYPITHGQQPRGIVTGPDGAIWFTEDTGIGRMTTSGKLTEYHLPDGNGAGMPYQIALGPDRNIWFVEYMPQGEGRVGRLTPSGNLTEFATPGMGGLQWITAGPDNALWITAAHTDNIGRVSLDGAVQAYAVPSLGAQPVGIMAGPDGNIWFAESPGDTTGKLGVFMLS
jgi:streptogramin lyase